MMNARLPHPQRTACLLAAATAALSGCASDQPADSAADESLFGGASSPRQQLVNVDNGLEVRKWLIVDQPDRIAAELTRIAEPMDLDESIVEKLERNGFRLLRIPADAIESLDDALGGATQDHSEWLGQAPLWQPLHEVGVRPGGQAVAVDGKVARYENGNFQLMVRAWTLPMEGGPHVHVELLPQFRKNRTVDYRDLLEGTPYEPTLFPSLATGLQLEPGYAYALVGASPQQRWPGDEAEPSRGPGSRGPGFGPETSAPRTLGEVMLMSDAAPPMRGVMIFVARIPPELYPAGYASSE